MNFRSLCKDVFANTLASIHSNQFRASSNEYHYSVLHYILKLMKRFLFKIRTAFVVAIVVQGHT